MNETWFFVGLLVFILVVWIALGGPTRGVSFSFPTISYAPGEAATTSGGGALALPRAPFGVGGASIHLPDIYAGIGGSGAPGSGSSKPLITVPGVVLPALSTYSGRVRLGSVVNASSSDATSEYLRLSVVDDRGPSIDITGWQLISGATYKNAFIPRGTLLPASGVVNATSDIVLDPGDSAIIVSGTSPVGGSFRESTCTGYFGSTQAFTPPLAASCPSAADDLAAYYGTPYIHDPSCIDYARTLPRCRIPVSGTGNLTLTCQDFLDTYMNYTGCVAAHQNNADFASKTWRIYLGRSTKNPLWRSTHEVVELLDRNGLLVDALSY
jgi:hypothetical protein